MRSFLLSLLAGFFFVSPTYASMNLKPLNFSNIVGWKKDDHREALKALRKSCVPILNAQKYKKNIGKSAKSDDFVFACKILQRLPKNIGRLQARKYFEKYFAPFEVRSNSSRKILTGYFEPELKGSRAKSAAYPVTVYKKPSDLTMIRGRSMRRLARKSRLDSRLSWARKVNGRLRPYATREQIENGYLNGRGLELLYLADPVDAFYMHVQGSARISLDTGEKVRIGFAAKNGYPFGSVERRVIKLGYVPHNRRSQKHIQAWLKANPALARKLFWVNRSYIFFREIETIGEKDGPIGAQGISLTAGRSLAVDNRFHRMGTPIWVVGKNKASRFGKSMRKLMIAQDVGSAIKGPERGDIYVGSGDRAGTVASYTYLQSNFVILLPKKRQRFSAR